MQRPRAVGRAALLPVALAAACIEPLRDSPNDPPLNAQLALTINAGPTRSDALAGVSAIEVTVNYARSDRTVIRLATQSLPNVPGPQTATIPVNVASCLTDGARTPPGSGCPLFVRVLLRDVQGAVVDSAQSTAVLVSAGQTIVSPPVSFLRVASIAIALPRPAWAVGDTGTATAATRDTASAPVNADIRWRSDNPAVVAVDSVTGRFAALTTGTARLIAASQGKEAQQALSIVAAPANPRCRGSGHTVVDTAQYRTPISFTASRSPYWMANGNVNVLARVDIPAGVTLCTGLLTVGADLGGYLRAMGTAAQPIVFTPLNDVKSILVFAFGGTPGDSSRFEHVLIDRGGDSTMGTVVQLGAHPVVLSNVRLRQNAVPRAVVSTSGTVGVRLSDVTVDTTSAVFAAGDGAETLQAAVSVNQLSVVERTTIRRAGRNGFEVLRTSAVPSSLRITTLAIEDASHDGYVAATAFAEPVSATSIRVSRAGRYPVSVCAPHFARAFPTRVAQQSVLGSGRDTAVIGAGFVYRDTLRAFDVLPWRTEGNVLLDSGAVLEATRGSSIGIAPNAILGARNLGRLRIRGDAQRPVRIHAANLGIPWSGIQLAGGAAYANSGDSSVIANAIIEGGGINSPAMLVSVHRVVIEETRFRDSPFIAAIIASTGSRITGAVFDSVGRAASSGTEGYALRLDADSIRARRLVVRGARENAIGVSAARGIVIDSSTITGSVGAGLVTGIQLGANGIRLSALNLFGNGAQSLRVDGTNQVDARNLWWGDPAGPQPGQVGGNALTAPAAPAPFVFSAPAVRSPTATQKQRLR